MIEPLSHWRKSKPLEWPPGSGNKAAGVWEHKLINMRVLRSKSKMRDGTEWIHISVSRVDRLPTWQELSKVKEEFLGSDAEAYHIIPRASDFVNIHNYCMHIWSHVNNINRLPNLEELEFEEAI